MGEITRYRPDWSQDSTMRIIAYLAPDAQGDAVTYADHLADREHLQITLKGWLKENAPGGWIDDLRKENAALKEQLAIKEREMSKQEILKGLKSGRKLRCDRRDEPLLPWLLSHPNIANSGIVQLDDQSSYIECYIEFSWRKDTDHD